MTNTVKNLKLTASEIENLDGLLYDLELLYKGKHDPISEELFDEVKAFRSRLSTKSPSAVLETLEWNVVQCIQDEDAPDGLYFWSPDREDFFLLTLKSGSVVTAYYDTDDGAFEDYDWDEIYAWADPQGAIQSQRKEQNKEQTKEIK